VHNQKSETKQHFNRPPVFARRLSGHSKEEGRFLYLQSPFSIANEKQQRVKVRVFAMSTVTLIFISFVRLSGWTISKVRVFAMSNVTLIFISFVRLSGWTISDFTGCLPKVYWACFVHRIQHNGFVPLSTALRESVDELQPFCLQCWSVTVLHF